MIFLQHFVIFLQFITTFSYSLHTLNHNLTQNQKIDK